MYETCEWYKTQAVDFLLHEEDHLGLSYSYSVTPIVTKDKDLEHSTCGTTVNI